MEAATPSPKKVYKISTRLYTPHGVKMKDKIDTISEQVIKRMLQHNAYFENGIESARTSIKEYLEKEYEKETAGLNLKIDMEKQRGLYKADAMERLETEARYISLRMTNKIEALAFVGKKATVKEEYKS